jgi:hypothetical protein
VWLEGLGKLKNPMTSSGIETTTFRLVAYDIVNKCCWNKKTHVQRTTGNGIPRQMTGHQLEGIERRGRPKDGKTKLEDPQQA